VRHVERVDAVLLLGLGRRQLLEPVVGDVELHRRTVEVLLDALHLVLRHVDLRMQRHDAHTEVAHTAKIQSINQLR